MDISEMTDQEKSVLLAKAMGWMIYGGFAPFSFAPDSDTHMAHNLYDPANMALAWRGLNWAMSPHHSPWVFALAAGDFELEGTLYESDLWKMPPADAQRLWLDRILELAIEAGIVEVNDGPTN